MPAAATSPGWFWVLPFAALLLCIALLPLIHKTAHWWELNRSKLIVALALGLVIALFVTLRPYGFDGSASGLPALGRMLHHAVLGDYIPFIVLLLSLYTISGGIRLTGDIPAHPITNTIFLAIGAVIASIAGTTGASMLLIRPLLQINQERHRVKHTVIFFIFIVSNVGGVLLPLGDPPLFLGYLRGVPFGWTLRLLPEWGFCVGVLLVVYYVWDHFAYKHERKADVQLDETVLQPLRLHGAINFIWLGGVVLAVALLTRSPQREIVLLALAAISYFTTPRRIHVENHFNFSAIAEVACLFIGIFLTMQAPIEILEHHGEALGIVTPRAFFWSSGALSSFLDNAPTYVVFFELAGSLKHATGGILAHVVTSSGQIDVLLLKAISCGAVFMGANSYIGNGPNFLVKAIADHHGVKMPSFFGYMAYSIAILIPLFIAVTFVFFRAH